MAAGVSPLRKVREEKTDAAMQVPAADVLFTFDGDRGAKKLFFILLAVNFSFVVFDIFFNYMNVTGIGAIRRMFNLAREDAIATWYSSTLTLFVGLILWLIYGIVKQDPASGRKPKAWALLAGFFTYLAIDDGASVHERIGTAVKKIAESRGLGTSEQPIFNFPSYTWQLVFGPVFAAMGVFVLVFLWREFKEKTQRAFFISALGCYALAVGLDFVEGIDNSYEQLSQILPFSASALSHFSRVLEEFIELLGSSLFLLAFLRHASRVTSGFSVLFKQK